MVVNKSWAWWIILVLFCGTAMLSCKEQKEHAYMFKGLTSERTGLRFSNRLNSTDSFNLFKYMYFYNGAGVGVGDFNNDGLADLFFASNQGANRLFINKGKLNFSDVTSETGINDDSAWSTGVSVIDINNDGLLDIYVCRVSRYHVLKGSNQLLICEGINEKGVPRYVERAKDYGLDFSGFGTQAAFLDYDLDGDLDMFLLNHSVHENGNYRARKFFTGTFNHASGSRLFRNDNLRFVDVTQSAGIYSTSIGYGLGITVSDINYDGYPDIYIGNDFHENDYLYINQKNGTFRDDAEKVMMHTSRYTMGVDVADLSNDGLPDIVSVDMLPSDPYILKRSPGEDSYDVFNLKIAYGYSYQYSRNALQLNRGNGHFSETALYSGVAATDWSWAPLIFDFDNDGVKDLFISNGIPKRLNDIDYINYISDQSIQQQIIENKINEKDKTLIEKFPQIKIPNKFYKNTGKAVFQDVHDSIADNVSSYSNGAAYADFDNDGDLDVVVNNIDEDAVVYQNLTNDNGNSKYLHIKLKGPQKNINGVGSKLIVFSRGEQRTYEKYPVRGFLSSMESPLHVGLDASMADSMLLIWPDNTFQSIRWNGVDSAMTLTYEPGLPKYEYPKRAFKPSTSTYHALDITSDVRLEYRHEENPFPEFDREPLMPHMVSTEGPALAVADINGDHLDDLFIGGSKGRKRGLFIQKAEGGFERIDAAALQKDSSYEDVDACWRDVNNDGFADLIIASGGNEYYGKDRHLLPRLYLNDGQGNLSKKSDAFSGIYHTSGCIAPYDFNNDGFTDLFIGGRGISWEYGVRPPSFLLQNDGTGKFVDVTDQYSASLKDAGFITNAVWTDVNNDKKQDLVVCGEWGTIDAYVNEDGKFNKKVILGRKGWWNFILPVDIDRDGNIDFIAGNVGANSRLKPSAEEPVRMYYNDFDDNGKKEQVLTYYVNGNEIPFANKAEMERQLPGMKKRFLYAKDFAKASLQEIVTGKKLSSSDVLSADYFASCIIMNKGNMEFAVTDLPWQLQLSSLRDAITVNANEDELPDIMLVGNYYDNNIEMGRYDADYGSLLINKGNGKLTYEPLDGVAIKGQSRRIKQIMMNGEKALVIARNNDSAMVIRLAPAK